MFQLPKGLRTFFKGIDRSSGANFDSMFDKYYLCAVVGMDERKLADENRIESDEFVKSYPNPYQEKADAIAGMLIDAEMDRKGIEPDNRNAIEKLMLNLMSLTSPTRLSSKGGSLLNRYSAGGFNILRREIDEPHHLSQFLVLYKQSFFKDEEL
ncbi:MAG: hypothetical protein ABEH43_06765 [Flavobacteriales bacterium]